MRVLVCGSRTWESWIEFLLGMQEHVAKRSAFYSETDNWLPSDIHIISGGARGVDTMAIDWAVINYCPFTEYKADWKLYGERAGPIRNQQMLDEGKPDLVVAFRKGKSKGTTDMIRRARKAGIETIVIEV